MKRPSATGFTLVELLVSIGIFTLITTVSVFNYSTFNASVALTNLAYEVALSVRQAQFYGITVKQSASSGGFDSGYGVHFTTANAYTLFEDRDRDHIYDTTPEEALETYSIQKGNTISRICVVSTSVDCSPTSLDLSFVRPNPDTFIVKNGVAGVYYASAIVCLSSPKGTYRKVLVEATGQISVSTDSTNCI